MKQKTCYDFNPSFGNIDLQLQPGDYDLMVDPLWNESADKHPEYKKVLVEIYSICDTTIVPISHESGMDALVTALKDIAINKTSDEEKVKSWTDYMPDYKDCYRI